MRTSKKKKKWRTHEISEDILYGNLSAVESRLRRLREKYGDVTLCVSADCVRDPSNVGSRDHTLYPVITVELEWEE